MLPGAGNLQSSPSIRWQRRKRKISAFFFLFAAFRDVYAKRVKIEPYKTDAQELRVDPRYREKLFLLYTIKTTHYV